MDLEPNLANWYAAEHQALVQRLKVAEQLSRHLPEQRKIAEVRRRASRLLRRELKDYEERLLDQTDGYTTRLTSKVTDALQRAPTSSGAWRGFDRDLTFLAALALAQGRDPALLAERVITAMAAATDAAGVALALRRVLGEPATQHRVALVIDGVSDVPDVARFKFRMMPRSNPQWPAGAEGRDEDVREFTRSQHAAGRCVCVLTNVEAHDARAGYALACTSGEELVAHLVAEHRVNDISLRRAALVLDTDGVIHRFPLPPRAAGTARAYGRRPQPVLSDSLRHYARSRSERAPALAVRDAWVALEGIALGAEATMRDGTIKPQGAGAFLPPHAAAAIVLTAARNQVVSLWQHLRHAAPAGGQAARWDEIRDWLGVSNRQKHVDLDRFAEAVVAATGSHPAPSLLESDSSVQDVGAVLLEVACALGPYSRQRLAELQERLSNGDRLGDWSALIDKRAKLQLQRMKFMRHRVVHRAAFFEPASLQLAMAGHDLVDGVYEALLGFLPDAGDVPWKALRDAHDHRDTVLRGWRLAGSTAPGYDAEHLVKP
jgi:hypothetical protein